MPCSCSRAAFAIDVGRYSRRRTARPRTAPTPRRSRWPRTACRSRQLAPSRHTTTVPQDAGPDDQPPTPDRCVVQRCEVTITVDKDVNDGLFLNRDARHRAQRSATAQWGTIGSANTVPITICARATFTPAMLDGTDATIILYARPPDVPALAAAAGPGGFGSLTDTGSDADCLTVSVVNDVAVGGTGSQRPCGTVHRRAGLKRSSTAGRLRTCSCPIYGAVQPGGSTTTRLHHRRLRTSSAASATSSTVAPGDAGTLDGRRADGAPAPTSATATSLASTATSSSFADSQAARPGPSTRASAPSYVYLSS